MIDSIPSRRSIYNATQGRYIEAPKNNKFIKGPISYDWVLLAAKISGKSASISFALWYLSGVQKSSKIKLTHKILQEFSISPKTAYRVLSSMEKAGLIKREQKDGQATAITILEI